VNVKQALIQKSEEHKQNKCHTSAARLFALAQIVNESATANKNQLDFAVDEILRSKQDWLKVAGFLNTCTTHVRLALIGDEDLG
jgi:hypothetical protein